MKNLEPYKMIEKLVEERDLAIKQLNSIGVGLGDNMDHVKKALEQRWIPCSERLPKYNQNVLVYRPGMAMQILVDRYEGYYGEDDCEWYEGWAYSNNCTVVAWMPLPEPYKEGE